MAAWTQEDDRILREMARRGSSARRIAEYMGRTENAVRTRCSNIGAMILVYGREPNAPIHLDFKAAVFDERPLRDGPRPVNVDVSNEFGPQCRVLRWGI